MTDDEVFQRAKSVLASVEMLSPEDIPAVLGAALVLAVMCRRPEQRLACFLLHIRGLINIILARRETIQ